MSISTTIIPQQIDLSTETDEVTIEYRTVNNSGSNKITIGDFIIKKLAEGELRATVLEVDAAITGATTSLEDIMTDATGLLNTVTTATTTSLYDNVNKYYYNPEISTDVSITDISTTSPINNDTWNIEFKKTCIFKEVKFIARNNGTGIITVQKNGNDFISLPSASYTNGEIYTILINDVATEGDYYRFNDNAIVDLFRTTNTDPVVTENDYFEANSNNYILATLAGNEIVVNDIDDLTPSAKEIVLSYNKAKPTALYFAPFSSSTGIADVGDVTISLYKDSTLLGTYEPYTIYEGLSLADTPNKAIITQEDTAISKIYQYVLLIE